jgi:predicted transcriptional regulator
MSLSHRLHVVVDPETATPLRRLAQEHHRTMGDLVREAIIEHCGTGDERWRAAEKALDEMLAAHDNIPLPDPDDWPASYERIRTEPPQ